jgi:hypothetical protein
MQAVRTLLRLHCGCGRRRPGLARKAQPCTSSFFSVAKEALSDCVIVAVAGGGHTAFDAMAFQVQSQCFALVPVRASAQFRSLPPARSANVCVFRSRPIRLCVVERIVPAREPCRRVWNAVRVSVRAILHSPTHVAPRSWRKGLTLGLARESCVSVQRFWLGRSRPTRERPHSSRLLCTSNRLWETR